MAYPNNGFGPPPPPSPPPSILIVLLNILNTITQLLLGSIVTCAFMFTISWGAFNVTTQLLNHIYLCVVGYILMMAQGVLAANSHSGWAASLKYEDKRMVHAAMQIIGAVLAMVGSFIRITDMDSNFDTPHGSLGLVAMVLTVINLIGGIVNTFIKPWVFIKVFHSCIGSLTILFAFLCLILGFDSYIYRLSMGDVIADFAIGLTVFGMLGVLVSASVSNVRRICYRSSNK